jgi:Tfp pilus assembly protein PilN
MKLSLHLPNRRFQKKSEIVWWVGFFVVWGIAFVAVGVVFVRQKRLIYELDVRSADLTKELSFFDQFVATKKEVADQHQKLVDHLKKMNKRVDGHTIVGLDLIGEVIKIIPEDLFLESFILNKKIEMKGFARSLKEITVFIERLSKSVHCKQPTLVLVGDVQQSLNKENFISFAIEASRG